MTEIEQCLLWAVKHRYSQSLRNTRVVRCGDFLFVLVHSVPVFCQKMCYDVDTRKEYTKDLFVEPKTKLEKSRLAVLGKDENSNVTSHETMRTIYNTYASRYTATSYQTREHYGFKVVLPNKKTKYFASRKGAENFAYKRGYVVDGI